MNGRALLMALLLTGMAGGSMLAQGRGGGNRPQDPGLEVRPPVDTAQFNPVKVVDKFKPIVDAPFIRAGEVKDQVRPEELVLGIVLRGHARAYPINMLIGPEREIINDTLEGRAIAATW